MSDKGAAFLRAQMQSDQGGQHIEDLQSKKQTDGWHWKRVRNSSLGGVSFWRHSFSIDYD
jgi:hypothetical protein